MHRLLSPLLALLAFALPLSTLARSTVRLAELSLGGDSNLLAAPDGKPRQSETFVQTGVSISHSEALAAGLSLRLQARLDARLHAHSEGLNRLGGGLEGQLLLRPGSSFYTPTITAAMDIGVTGFQSRLRDAQQAQFRLLIRQPLTTRMQARGGLFTLWQGSESAVFDSHIQGVEAAVDWQAQRALTLTLGYQYRTGAVESVGNPSPVARANALALQADDVFAGRTVLSLQAQTHIGLLAANWALSPGLSLDAQLRYVESDPRFDARYSRWTTITGLLARF